MFRKLFKISITIMFTILSISTSNAYEYDECPSVKYVAKDLGYSVKKYDKGIYELSKGKALFYAEIDREFCTVNFIANVFDVSENMIAEITEWNNKGKLGKGVFDENNIYFEYFILLAEASDKLLALNIAIYDAALEDFHKHFSEIQKVRMKI